MSEDISLITVDRINELQNIINSLRNEITQLQTELRTTINTEITNLNNKIDNDINTKINQLSQSIAANDATCLHKANTETATGAKTFSGGLTCSNNFNLTGQYFGTNISNQTLDANNLWVKLNGATKIYYTTSDGATANITNLPNTRSLKLISESVRYISDSDYLIYQTAIQGNVRYERTCTNGTWTAWTNENSRIISIMNSKKSDIINWMLPNYSKKTTLSANVEYTATENGWIYYYTNNSSGYFYLNGEEIAYYTWHSGVYHNYNACMLPVSIGDKYKATSVTRFYFYPCKGNS